MSHKKTALEVLCKAQQTKVINRWFSWAKQVSKSVPERMSQTSVAIHFSSSFFVRVQMCFSFIQNRLFLKYENINYNPCQRNGDAKKGCRFSIFMSKSWSKHTFDQLYFCCFLLFTGRCLQWNHGDDRTSRCQTVSNLFKVVNISKYPSDVDAYIHQRKITLQIKDVMS